MEDPWRLFIGIATSPELTASLRRVQTALRPKLKKFPLRYERPENFHLTLLFLGDVESVRVRALAQAIASSTSERSAFTIEAAGVGAFPRAAAARVLWAGVGRSQELSGLQQAVVSAASALGFVQNKDEEKRDFVPHFTLARSKKPFSAIKLLERLSAKRLGTLSVGETLLYRVHTGDAVTRYEVLERFPLNASAFSRARGPA